MTTEKVAHAPFPESLCHRCAHVRVIESKRGTRYLKCGEPTRPKYSPQPVLDCSVFTAAADHVPKIAGGE